jgi:glucose-1-phosphate cytidylyltransferase
MKVVLFCGGLGTRLREFSDTTPKPLVNVGYRPILLHLMKYYAYYGHKDFVLCLGYRGDLIKEYFLGYNECLTNDFTLIDGGRKTELKSRDLEDWKITFVDTGLHSSIGERLFRVRQYLKEEAIFLANYADGLTDLDFDMYLKQCMTTDAIGSFLSVRTPDSFHAVHTDDDGLVTDFGRVKDTEFWVNAGYFVFRQEIFDHIKKGEELVEEPFSRLIKKKRLYSFKYKGFWKNMDTFKDKIDFDRLNGSGESPWEVWRKGARG